MFEAVKAGATDPAIEDVEVVTRPALAATVLDVLGADGYLLGTPANFGYMSGALKHFFDSVYYPCLDATIGRPYALYVHGNNDADGDEHVDADLRRQGKVEQEVADVDTPRHRQRYRQHCEVGQPVEPEPPGQRPPVSERKVGVVAAGRDDGDDADAGVEGELQE